MSNEKKSFPAYCESHGGWYMAEVYDVEGQGSITAVGMAECGCEVYTAKNPGRYGLKDVHREA